MWSWTSPKTVEIVTMDHILAYTDNANSITRHLKALMFYDRGTRWVESFPTNTLGAVEAYKLSNAIKSPKESIDYVYCDASAALKKTLDMHRMGYDTSTPGQPKTNGITGRQVQEVINGTRVLQGQDCQHPFGPTP